jgi:hypothetical protein
MQDACQTVTPIIAAITSLQHFGAAVEEHRAGGYQPKHFLMCDVSGGDALLILAAVIRSVISCAPNRLHRDRMPTSRPLHYQGGPA